MATFKVELFGAEVTRDDIRDVWDVFVKPTQDDWAPPQSIETRTLMAVLRGAYTMLPPTDKEPGEYE